MLQSVNDVNLAKFLDFDAPWPELCRSGLWLLILGSESWQETWMILKSVFF